MAFCVNCGEKLIDGSKFCHMCGTPVGGSVSPNSQRRDEFVGKILKCPSCGSVINESTVICPECGMQITGREAVSSVKKFADELMKIEATRKGGVLNLLTSSSNNIYNQKINLIKNFPIPNTIDDIKEFIFLAIANIDVKLSKNTLGAKFASMSHNNDLTKTYKIDKDISDAWVAKMQQAYQKALSSFPNDPSFNSIQNVYLEKMKELNIKK